MIPRPLTNFTLCDSHERVDCCHQHTISGDKKAAFLKKWQSKVQFLLCHCLTGPEYCIFFSSGHLMIVIWLFCTREVLVPQVYHILQIGYIKVANWIFAPAPQYRSPLYVFAPESISNPSFMCLLPQSIFHTLAPPPSPSLPTKLISFSWNFNQMIQSLAHETLHFADFHRK